MDIGLGELGCFSPGLASQDTDLLFIKGTHPVLGAGPKPQPHDPLLLDPGAAAHRRAHFLSPGWSGRWREGCFSGFGWLELCWVDFHSRSQFRHSYPRLSDWLGLMARVPDMDLEG